ncbi:MAG: DUF4960 domain-containing protein [Bacteroidales bacterium]|nr:DUF4960 domain-containing protein [Bacteroidales bacterium]
MKPIYLIIGCAIALTSCQDRDIDTSVPILSEQLSASLSCQLIDDDLQWSWTQPGTLSTQITLYADGTKAGTEVVDGNTYTHKNVDTNVEYTYVFKSTDGTNYSTGVVMAYTRLGASAVSSVSMKQVDVAGGYNALVEWTSPADATEIQLTATNGSRTISETLSASETEYVISNVVVGDNWSVTLRAANSQGSSLASTTSLKIGKTAIGFLSVYPTAEELIEQGDDDEACAWLWLQSEYPSSEYVYFGDIASADDLEPYRVLFWLRDLEGVDENAVFTMSDIVTETAPYVSERYKAGGNLLLWSHAVPYIATLGRVSMDDFRNNDRSIGCGYGGYNADTWSMAVQLHPGSNFKLDFSSHSIYKGLEVTETDRTKLISFKGPGWSEDHNCLSFNLPSVWTGLGNQDMACYTMCTETLGIYPLGIWDSQIDWISQLNVWEARQGQTEYQGTVLCIGNGGCEFSMRNPDGSADISAYPKNNIYQTNVLTLASNSLEYLKTR